MGRKWEVVQMRENFFTTRVMAGLVCGFMLSLYFFLNKLWASFSFDFDLHYVGVFLLIHCFCCFHPFSRYSSGIPLALKIYHDQEIAPPSTLGELLEPSFLKQDYLCWERGIAAEQLLILFFF